MKKIRSIIFGLVAVFAMAMTASAADIDIANYATEDLNTVFTEEGITSTSMGNYNPQQNSVPIYVFRGTGCGYCKYFYQYVADELLATHGDKINVISFEIKNEPTNWNLAKKIQEYRGEYGGAGLIGTPYIVIGDRSFTGDISGHKAEITSIIDSLYNNQDAYDIIDDMNTNKKVFTAGNITFTSNKGIDKTYTLHADPIDRSNVLLAGYNYIDAYDINMKNGANVVAIPTGVYTIRIPVSAAYDTYEVAFIENDQIMEQFSAKYENGEIVFTTSHLSEYAIYGKNNAQVVNPDDTTSAGNSANHAPNNAQTSSMNILLYFVLAAGSFVSIITILVRKKKEIA